MSVKTKQQKPLELQTNASGWSGVSRVTVSRHRVYSLYLFVFTQNKNTEKLVKTDYATGIDRYTHLFLLRICAKSLLPSTSQSPKTSDLKNLWVSYPFQIIILRSLYNLLWVTKQNEKTVKLPIFSALWWIVRLEFTCLTVKNNTKQTHTQKVFFPVTRVLV